MKAAYLIEYTFEVPSINKKTKLVTLSPQQLPEFNNKRYHGTIGEAHLSIIDKFFNSELVPKWLQNSKKEDIVVSAKEVQTMKVYV